MEQPRTKRMWVVWMLYFFQYAAIGAYYTFLNVYFHNAGLSGTQIGLLNMFASIVGVGGSVLWGYFSDRSGHPKVMIAIGGLGTLLAAQAIPYVSGFWLYLVFSCLGSLMNAAPNTLVDSTALVMLGKRREDYGKYRLGGSIGYIITAFASGLVYQKTGLGLLFPAYGVFLLCFTILALFLPPITLHLESSGRKEIIQMIRQPMWMIFITCTFLCWIGVNASITFLPVSLSALGASQSLIGYASTIQAVVEMPFMFFSGYFLRRVGPIRLLIVGMILLIIRFFLLGWMPTPTWAIAINMLNGPGFVLFWNSAINYANRLAPRGIAGTAQGLIISVTSLAAVVSSLLSGWLFDQVGPRGIFTVMAFLALSALILFSIGTMIIKPSRKDELTAELTP